MKEKKWDVIVIGSGPGGLACAAMLVKSGKRVLVLEKNDHVGGKPVTVERGGYRYELGPKLQVPMRDPAFRTLFRELGMEDRLGQVLLDAATLCYRPDGSGEFRVQVAPQTGDDPTPLFDLWDLDDSERERAIAAMAEMVSLDGDALDELDEVSMKDYLATLDVPWGLYSYMAMHANASLAEPIDRVAASEQLRIIQEIAASGGGGYYLGGFGRVLADVAAWLRANGAEILTRQRVGEILVSDGRVRGVATAGSDFRAPVVVSSAGIQPTVLKLVGERHFDQGFVERLRALEPGGGWATVRYFLDRPVLETGMALAYSDQSWWDLARARAVDDGEIPDEVTLFLTVPAVFDPTMAPAGKQCVIAGTLCSPDPLSKTIEPLYRRVDAMFERVFPAAWHAVERKECDGPLEVSDGTRDSVLPGQGGECVGLGQVVGQCGRLKPDPELPVDGLFLAGCDAGAPSMGTHQATGSGMKVAGLVERWFDHAYAT